jgi:hypothetical protein
MVVAQSCIDFRYKTLYQKHSRLSINSSALNKLTLKVHNDTCACYDDIMNDLSIQRYEVNFVNKFGSEGFFYLFSGDIVFPTSVPKLNIINPVNK